MHGKEGRPRGLTWVTLLNYGLTVSHKQWNKDTLKLILIGLQMLTRKPIRRKKVSSATKPVAKNYRIENLKNSKCKAIRKPNSNLNLSINALISAELKLKGDSKP